MDRDLDVRLLTSVKLEVGDGCRLEPLEVSGDLEGSRRKAEEHETSLAVAHCATFAGDEIGTGDGDRHARQLLAPWSGHSSGNRDVVDRLRPDAHRQQNQRDERKDSDCSDLHKSPPMVGLLVVKELHRIVGARARARDWASERLATRENRVEDMIELLRVAAYYSLIR